MKKWLLIITVLSVSITVTSADRHHIDEAAYAAWAAPIETRIDFLKPIIANCQSSDLALKITGLQAMTAIPLAAESLAVLSKLEDILTRADRDELVRRQYAIISETLLRQQGTVVPEPVGRDDLTHLADQFIQWLFMAKFTGEISEDKFHNYAHPLTNVTATYMQERFNAYLTAALEFDSDEKI